MVKRADKGMPYAYLHDGTRSLDRMGAQRTPEFFLLNADGVVTYHGRMDDNPRDPTNVTTSELKDAIDAMLAGSTPEFSSQIPLAAQSNGSDGLSGCIRQCDWDENDVCRSCGTDYSPPKKLRPFHSPFRWMI